MQISTFCAAKNHHSFNLSTKVTYGVNLKNVITRLYSIVSIIQRSRKFAWKQRRRNVLARYKNVEKKMKNIQR